jgi:phytoene dehydrogenase-like protein
MTPSVVIVGGGHNALVAAALLGRGGVPCLVLERRGVLGGASVTEEFHPGFRVSALAHVAGPVHPSLLQTLGLPARGLGLLQADPSVYAPLPDGTGVSLYADPVRSARGIEAVSKSDARSYTSFHECTTALAAALHGLLEMTPPDIAAPMTRDMLGMLRAGLKARGLGRSRFQDLLRWGPMAVADFAAEWFESDLMRAIVCGRGIRGVLAGPWSAGTTANLLLQAVASGGSGADTAVGVRGGLGALSEALAKAAQESGAVLRTNAAVSRIVTRDGRVTGVRLASGEEIPARAVVSGVDPHTTFLKLLEPTDLDPDDLQRVRHIRIAGMVSKVHLALSGLPAFKGLPKGDATALGGRIHIGPGVDYLERAFDDAKYGRPSSRPFLDVTLPTVLDPSLAPPGHHVLSAAVQFTPFRLASGEWKSRKDEVGDGVLKTLEEYAPGISSLVVHRQVLTPLDLQEVYGLTGGHPHHGEVALDQLFTMRPLIGWGRYRGPVPGLFLCGAGTHPGGGVTGIPGMNAAREILRDLR